MQPTTESPNLRRNATIHAAFVAAMLTVAGGCAGPWAQSSNIPLPTARATPAGVSTENRAAPIQLPASVEVESGLPETIEAKTNNETEIDTDIVIRGQSPESGITSDGAPPPPGKIRPVQYTEDAIPGVTGAIGNGSFGSSSPAGPVGANAIAPPVGIGRPGPGQSSFGPVGQQPVGQRPVGSAVAPTQSVGSGAGYQPVGNAPTPGNTATAPVGAYSPTTTPSGYIGGTPGGYGSQGGFPTATGGDFLDATQGYGPAYSDYDGSAIAPPYTEPADYADLIVNLNETQTGRFMFGVGVNSDLGLSAQAVIDERNFDWRRWPRSFDEIINGTAWRGGGQSLRIEAVPGSQVQRYMINFTQPYLFDTPISFNLSGYLFDRRYFDWDEQRLGGRMGLGYRITQDLSLAVALRAEQVDFHNPRVRGIPIIENVLGESDLYSGRISLTHDTRDLPFAATEGHYLELSFEQVFGSFDYSRGNVDYRRYFLLKQRADGSGRHTLGLNFRGGVTGEETPVYENFFAGGYSTMRGFRFRHASPKISDVIVGGRLSLLGTAEYVFPITADDMLRGAIFCDYGTIEEELSVDAEDFRVAVGAGLRFTVPAMGPAPIAVDFAVPINREDTDRIQNFSFFVGFGR